MFNGEQERSNKTKRKERDQFGSCSLVPVQNLWRTDTSGRRDVVVLDKPEYHVRFLSMNWWLPALEREVVSAINVSSRHDFTNCGAKFVRNPVTLDFQERCIPLDHAQITPLYWWAYRSNQKTSEALEHVQGFQRAKKSTEECVINLLYNKFLPEFDRPPAFILVLCRFSHFRFSSRGWLKNPTPTSGFVSNICWLICFLVVLATRKIQINKLWVH